MSRFDVADRLARWPCASSRKKRCVPGRRRENAETQNADERTRMRSLKTDERARRRPLCFFCFTRRRRCACSRARRASPACSNCRKTATVRRKLSVPSRVSPRGSTVCTCTNSATRPTGACPRDRTLTRITWITAHRRIRFVTPGISATSRPPRAGATSPSRTCKFR